MSGAELYVMVRGVPTVWRLVDYDANDLCLVGVNGLGSLVVSKSICRVGEARHWERSRHSTAWHAGWKAARAEIEERRAPDAHV